MDSEIGFDDAEDERREETFEGRRPLTSIFTLVGVDARRAFVDGERLCEGGFTLTDAFLSSHEGELNVKGFL